MILSAFVGLAIAQVAGSTGNELTVYNQGFALVKEIRSVDLVQGRQLVSIVDVASQIETNSVGIRSLTDPNAFEVWEQNYQYDLISPIAILNKAVGQPIRFRRVLPNGQVEVLSGTLISSPTAIVGNQQGGSASTYNGMVIRADDGRIVLNPAGEIEVSSLPEGLISKPTLVWDLFAQKAGRQNVELSYLTRGTSWNADYVLTLNGMGAADLRGWVTMTNNSGATWKDAKLKLLAGDVQRIQQVARGGFGGAREALGAADKAGFQEESLFEYHLYTLNRPTTLADNQTKQVALLGATAVPVTKELLVNGSAHYYSSGVGEIGQKLKAGVYVGFDNRESARLGVPLPKGVVRVYKRDGAGNAQFVGEDRIDHTPRNEKVRLHLGDAFDVTADKKQTDFKRRERALNAGYTFESAYELVLRNAKKEAVTVTVREPVPGDWTMLEQNHPHEKVAAGTAQWRIKVPAGGSSTLQYRVLVRY